MKKWKQYTICIKRGEKVTEAAMGGIECGKCHY